MAWIYLLIAGLFEIVWAVGIKYCDSFKISLPLLLVILSMVFSIIFLGMAVKTIPMSIAYAVWTGIGIVGVFTYGVFILKEPISIINMIFIGLILVGIVGLKLQIKA
jgi:quaternary ammonium compound-resistance protein SugE